MMYGSTTRVSLSPSGCRFAAAAVLASVPSSHHSVGSRSRGLEAEGIVETVKGYEDLVVQWGSPDNYPYEYSH